MKNIKAFFIILITLSVNSLLAQVHQLQSPDKKIVVKIDISNNISYSVFYNNNQVLSNCPVWLELAKVGILGQNPRLIKAEKSSVSNVQTAVVPCKQLQIPDNYNQLNLVFKGKYAVTFRAYNNGVAYRFQTSLKQPVEIINEQAQINFSQNTTSYFAPEQSFISHYEQLFNVVNVAQIPDSQFSALPVYFKSNSGVSMVFTETDVYDYPCMFLKGTNGNGLKAVFPKVPLNVEANRRAPDRNEVIVTEAGYIAKTQGTRVFPWRVLMLAANDACIVENNLAWQLARPLAIDNTSWIKPGKVAWDWWNANNIYGVGFESGINNQTYKYYIDFASEFGLEYIILDEGWSKSPVDVLECNSQIDVAGLVRYAEHKNVGVILWLLWKPLQNDMENILKTYKQWGVKGIKVDFMQRADQLMVNYYHQVAQMAAKYQLLVDFHGSFKPSGLQKAYPNVLSHEGVKGLENNKWGSDITPEHNLTLPFTRMTAGPMDYTPGAMDNAMGADFFDRFYRPMAQGTRAHQVAMYVVYESPLQMLADNPTNYYNNKPCTQFISKIPTTWDDTRVIDAQIADYIVIARRNNNKWYVAAMTDQNSRTFEIDLSFIDSSFNNIEYLADGINAKKVAVDYKTGSRIFKHTEKLKIELAPGGGFAAIISIK